MALAINPKDHDGGHGLSEQWRVFQRCGEHSYIKASNAIIAIRSRFSDETAVWRSLPGIFGEQQLGFGRVLRVEIAIKAPGAALGWNIVASKTGRPGDLSASTYCQYGLLLAFLYAPDGLLCGDDRCNSFEPKTM